MGLFALLSAFGCGSDDPVSEPDPDPAPVPFEITIAGVGPNGIFDPAPASDTSSGLWMSYSEVSAHPSEARLTVVCSRAAVSTDAGRNWTDVGVVNAAELVTLPPPDDTKPAAWIHEVSRIVYDPFATAGTEWKMIWHRYLTVFSGVPLRLFEHGWMSLRTASAPDGVWSAERKLFTGFGYDTANDVTIGPPEFPLDTLFPGVGALGSCLIYTEPAMLVRPEGIYVAMKCADLLSGKIILLLCAHDFSTVAYLGDFVTNADATLIDSGYTGFSAPEFVETTAATYLIVTPTVGDGYRGCLVLRVDEVRD
ncbi:MAG: hypothetical protein IH969_01405, partial [Candidatus Krumholzibacteriota bacterium]|nr:hypothetical protein [Candidatus Krumholzibacteriota bacterium]